MTPAADPTPSINIDQDDVSIAATLREVADQAGLVSVPTATFIIVAHESRVDRLLSVAAAGRCEQRVDVQWPMLTTPRRGAGVCSVETILSETILSETIRSKTILSETSQSELSQRRRMRVATYGTTCCLPPPIAAWTRVR